MLKILKMYLQDMPNIENTINGANGNEIEQEIIFAEQIMIHKSQQESTIFVVNQNKKGTKTKKIQHYEYKDQ